MTIWNVSDEKVLWIFSFCFGSSLNYLFFFFFLNIFFKITVLSPIFAKENFSSDFCLYASVLCSVFLHIFLKIIIKELFFTIIHSKILYAMTWIQSSYIHNMNFELFYLNVKFK